MTTTDGSSNRTGDKRYHHGNLRAALLAAATTLANERGLQAVTLREVARQAGVSHAAPYHHFADKAALVEALVLTSFTAFAEALRTAHTHTDGTALQRLQAVGIAYVQFAVDNPALFRLMFRPELYTRPAADPATPPAPSPVATTIEQVAPASYRVIVTAIEQCQDEGSITPGDPQPLAFTAWATVHGLAVLVLDGTRHPYIRGDDGTPRHTALAQVVTRTLLAGLCHAGDAVARP